MITVAAVWFLMGLIVIIGMLVLAILKQIKWKAFGISTSIYIVVLFFLFVIVGSQPTTNNTKNSKSSSELASTAKIFKLIYNDDEDYSDEIHFESNKDGKYIVKVKGLHNGKIKLANKDDSEEKFQTRTYKIKKGQTLKIPIQLKGDDLVHNFEITDNNDNSKDFSIYNNSEKANSIADSMSANESSSSSITNYQQVRYDDLARHSKKMNGKDISITGSIIQVEHEDGMYMLLVAMNGDPDQTVMVAVDKSDKPKNGDMVKNDLVTIQGTAGGKQKYTTVMGDDNEVPYIDCNEVIQDQGKAPDDYGD